MYENVRGTSSSHLHHLGTQPYLYLVLSFLLGQKSCTNSSILYSSLSALHSQKSKDFANALVSRKLAVIIPMHCSKGLYYSPTVLYFYITKQCTFQIWAKTLRVCSRLYNASCSFAASIGFARIMQWWRKTNRKGRGVFSCWEVLSLE